MSKKLLFSALVIALLLVACQTAWTPITSTPTVVPSQEPTVDETDVPTAQVPTETSTEVIVPTATEVVVDPPTPVVTQATPIPSEEPTQPVATVTPLPPVNRFDNPGFEGNVRSVGFNEVNVFYGWMPFYCDQPYTPEKCPALRRDNQSPPRTGYNDPGLLFGRPEFKPVNPYIDDCEHNPFGNRVHSGCNAQQWFGFFRAVRGGVFQIVATQPGEICRVTAWVQTWSESGGTGISDAASADDRSNSTWVVRVDTNGGTFAYTPDILVSDPLDYEHGHYDHWALLQYSFVATSNQATIFFENIRLWPIAHNDAYLDDVAILCEAP